MVKNYELSNVQQCVTNLCVTKSRDSSRNMDLNDQLQSGRSVTETHSLNRHKINKLNKKNQYISQTVIMEKLKIGLASVNHVIAGLGHGWIYA
jgi:biotin operon repressor